MCCRTTSGAMILCDRNPGLASLRPGLYAAAPFGGYDFFEGLWGVTLVYAVFWGGIMAEMRWRFEIEEWNYGVWATTLR